MHLYIEIETADLVEAARQASVRCRPLTATTSAICEFVWRAEEKETAHSLDGAEFGKFARERQLNLRGYARTH